MGSAGAVVSSTSSGLAEDNAALKKEVARLRQELETMRQLNRGLKIKVLAVCVVIRMTLMAVVVAAYDQGRQGCGHFERSGECCEWDLKRVYGGHGG